MALGFFAKLAEEKIRQAVERGEMDDLPGLGQPLDFEDDAMVPEDLRMAHHVLKNAGFIPPEVELRGEIARTEELLVAAPDEKARYIAIKRLNFLTMKLGELRPRSALLDEHAYAQRIVARLCRDASGEKGS
ncbi:DnaJ-like, subfamily C, member 28, conserved domain protein [Desulfarculus baarsii DSM 2075]|uniref:DnaJ-like, subfamily C, member 28, conserved domain protein n=1 Tax=Desulfarculus baarsii (strain ATCC 33931 / DSM 2075 / LMG 7858 / VKM B-1802 / 2st14) TaxID=644282 RepID=E1QKQ2_DESB2|nr:DUF1992 domain-containing protein [Desulfarculus baarsii]ADK86261.1 DnaJ-like, subfamily C, member 28, conserved domain protein [Desulfarculus baarsii DSM 2075]